MTHIIDRVNLKNTIYLVRDSSAAVRSDVDAKFAEIKTHIDASVGIIDASINHIMSKIAQLDNVMSEEEYESIVTPKNELYFVFEN